jgi:pimeloyl-ACP methyl ester carboxylesterase
VTRLEEQIAIETGWGRLAGTLCLPAGAGPFPAVLIIGGSGPTDRDGNNPLLPAPFDNLKRLAHALAARGLASLRYDKRGVGASTFPGLSEETLRFDQLVDDALAWCEQLRQDRRLSREPVLLGHSEGALVASLAAARGGARAVVSVAGAGEKASALMRRQIQSVLPADLLGPALQALAAMEAGQAAADVPDDLVLLFRPTVQPYLISWFRHDPAEVLAMLDMPVLLVHGQADAQVPPEHALRLQERTPSAQLRLVPGMDHLLALDGDIGAGAARVAEEAASWLQGQPVRETA